MRSTPEQDARLRARLQEAVDKVADGSADKMGRLLGYANGGYLREILGSKAKPVREKIIQRFAESTDPTIASWFDGYVSNITAADLAEAAAKHSNPWPFRYLSPAEWALIDPRDWAVAESAALDALEKQRQRARTAHPLRQPESSPRKREASA
jgi:hypothetical protein